MRVITRQFTREILLSTCFVLLALVALFAFFDLINQLDNVGKDYTLTQAFLFTAMALPARIYEVMPIAALLAAVYTMSRWAANSEFTVLRVAGMSPIRLALSLMVPGIILVAATYLFGEVVAPPADKLAQEMKIMAKDSVLTARGYSSGVWVRDVTTNTMGMEVNRYINVKNLVVGEENRTGPWRMFEFDTQGRLLRMIRADSAMYEKERGWLLHNAVELRYPKINIADNKPMTGKVEMTSAVDYLVPSQMGPDILGVMTVKPENMSMLELDRYLAHLQKNNQQTEHYEIAFWNKAFYPLAIIVMLALAMPFGYLNARSGGMAIKIFLGVMIGVAFYALNNLFAYLGVLNTWPPLAVAVVPTTVMLLAAGIAMYLVERR